MNRRLVILFTLIVLCAGMVYSQALTRIAVVDLPRVYTEFLRESQAVREFEAKSARVQNEIDRMTREIQALRTRHAEAIQNDNESEMIRLETEINRRTENLRTYYQARTAELERDRQNLMQSGSFLNEVRDEIRFIAEREGYTNVFDIKNTPGMIWYSPTVDITDRLIASLRSRTRN